MKILFTADIHIKLGQKNVPIEWARNRYFILGNELRKVIESESIELLIIGGDIFDRIPTIDELEVYFDLIDTFSVPTIIYSGNHEALKKNTTFLTNLKRVTAICNNWVTIVDDFETFNGIDFIPYNKLKEKWPDTLKSRILCTHVRGEIPPHVKPEINLELFDRWDLVIAGDLHSYSNSQRNILYPGSPVTTSFHRNLVDTGVIVLDSSTLEHTWHKLEVPQLIRKTINAGDPMPATDYHHTIYEVSGDMSELSSVENSELLDKKVVTRDTDTTLILDPKMSLLEEVEEYARYVLQLNDSTVEAMLKELNNHMGELQE